MAACAGGRVRRGSPGRDRQVAETNASTFPRAQARVTGRPVGYLALLFQKGWQHLVSARTHGKFLDQNKARRSDNATSPESEAIRAKNRCRKT